MATTTATTTTTTTPTPTLSFPRPIFAAVSPHPFLQAHLTSTPKQPLRANGRTAHAFRNLGVNTGSLTHCNGSAVIRMGNTAVVCGVRAEILAVDEGQEDVVGDDSEEEEGERREIEERRLLVPNIELATGSAPQHLPGQAPSGFAQTLVSRLRALLVSTGLVRARDLRILYTPPSSSISPDDDEEVEREQEAGRTEVKAYWVLYIDTMFLSLDGNAFDAAWLAILGALRDTRLPHAYWDEELETILCSDDPAGAHKLNLRGLPVPSSYAVFDGKGENNVDGEESRSWILSDPDSFEEGVCRETVCVVIDQSIGKREIKKMEKNGGGIVDRVVMKTLVERSVERWGVWEKVLSGS